MSFIKLIANLRIAVVFIIPFALLLETSGKPGADKREEVIRLLKVEMEKQGILIPDWLGRFVDPLLGLFVDVVVGILNRTGFFGHSEPPLTD